MDLVRQRSPKTKFCYKDPENYIFWDIFSYLPTSKCLQSRFTNSI